MSRTRKIVIALAAAVVAALLVFALLPSPVPVTATTVERGYFQDFVEEEGRTVLREPYVLAIPVSGFLLRVEVDAGDPVEAGQILFELEPAPAPALDERARRQAREAVGTARAQAGRAEAELEAREAETRYAEREFDRIQRLEERDAVPVAQLDLARSELERARGLERAAERMVDAARFELRNAEAVLEVAEGERAVDEPIAMRAPVDGIVLRRHRWSEGPAQAGEPVLEIGDLANLEVQVDLLSMDAVRVRPEMRVVLTRWGGETDLEARVARVDPAGFTQVSALGVEEQRVPVRVQFEEPEEAWEALGDGYRVEARFVIWEDDDTLSLPAGALFRDRGEWAVFVIEDGRARLRQIETGRSSGGRTRILDGLRENDIVVLHPGDRVQDGVRVERR